VNVSTSAAPDLANGVIMVELHGLLSVGSSPIVRAVLHTALAQAPDAAIVDISDLRVDRPSRLAVFPAAVRAHGSPAATLVLCGATPEVSALMRNGVLGTVATYRDCEAALAALASARDGGSDRLWLRLASTPDAPARARELVATACRRWALPELRGPAALVMSELVSNSVQHAGTDIVVRLARNGDHLYLSVRDGSPVPPRVAGGAMDGPLPYGAGTLADRGRGLHLVDTYTTAWGCNVAGDGKTVWATLRTSGQDSTAD
jgi:anti-sigma regulatory factor (Ser/Thr protein kinase)